jgi:hypothetical protein
VRRVLRPHGQAWSRPLIDLLDHGGKGPRQHLRVGDEGATQSVYCRDLRSWSGGALPKTSSHCTRKGSRRREHARPGGEWTAGPPPSPDTAPFTLHSFYRHAVAEEGVVRNPVANVRRSKGRPTPPWSFFSGLNGLRFSQAPWRRT